MQSDRFRNHHLLALLKEYQDQQTLPLDLLIHRYFRDNKALGSKDRGVIADTLYGIVRWKGLLDHLCNKPATWEERVLLYRKIQCASYAQDLSIPSHIRLSFPKYLFEILVQSYGEEKAATLCLVSNSSAPTTVRVNLLKTTRQELLAQWGPLYDIFPCSLSET